MTNRYVTFFASLWIIIDNYPLKVDAYFIVRARYMRVTQTRWETDCSGIENDSLIIHLDMNEISRLQVCNK